MTCKDCIHHNMCRYIDCFRTKDSDGEKKIIAETNNVEDTCEDFSNRYLWAKFPCLTGTTVYSVYHEISGKRNIVVGTVEHFKVYGDNYVYAYVFYENGASYWHLSTEFGKIVFFTYEEAERALKDRSDEE